MTDAQSRWSGEPGTATQPPAVPLRMLSHLHRLLVSLECADRLSLALQGAVVSDQHRAVHGRLCGEYGYPCPVLQSQAAPQSSAEPCLHGRWWSLCGWLPPRRRRPASPLCHGGGVLDSTAGKPMWVRAYLNGLAARGAPGVKACKDPWPPADDEACGAVREHHDLLG